MSSEFEKAAEDVQNLAKPPSNDEKLQLYALFKIGKGEEPKKPGMFDMVAKAKFKKWEEEKAAGMTAEQAQKKYVEYVGELKTTYGMA